MWMNSEIAPEEEVKFRKNTDLIKTISADYDSIDSRRCC